MVLKKNEKLKFIRFCTGLSQSKFCYVFGFSLVTYKKWESGRVSFRDWLIPLLVHAVRDLGYFCPLSLIDF